MKITTNNHPRDLIALADMPEAARADFDYIEGEDQFSPRMFKYRGAWFDACEFTRIAKRSGRDWMAHTVDDDSPLLAWDGIQTDTYFSGVVLRYVGPDNEAVAIGRVYS